MWKVPGEGSITLRLPAAMVDEVDKPEVATVVLDPPGKPQPARGLAELEFDDFQVQCQTWVAGTISAAEVVNKFREEVLEMMETQYAVCRELDEVTESQPPVYTQDLEADRIDTGPEEAGEVPTQLDCETSVEPSRLFNQAAGSEGPGMGAWPGSVATGLMGFHTTVGSSSTLLEASAVHQEGVPEPDGSGAAGRDVECRVISETDGNAGAEE